jgi:hypothetical protein
MSSQIERDVYSMENRRSCWCVVLLLVGSSREPGSQGTKISLVDICGLKWGWFGAALCHYRVSSSLDKNLPWEFI